MMWLVFGTILPWLLLAAGAWIGFQLVRQGGRMLLRLDSVEGRVTQMGSLLQAISAPRHPTAHASPALGSEAPDFELPDLLGERHRLSAYRGRRVLVVFFSPNCGYCVQMAPELAALSFDDPLPLVITSGAREENQRLVAEHEMCCPVLLQARNEVAERYSASGTPMGYLIDAQGRIASALGVGAEGVLALARQSSADGDLATSRNGRKPLKGLRPLSESRLLRTGLAEGAPAPEFSLPRVDGGRLSLSEYRGQRVLLVFSDPNCGPCTALAQRLEAATRRGPAPSVVMVSRGTLDENHRKVVELGLTFPVVIQRQWEVSRDYGMFATPAGFLIDELGRVATAVATGADAVLSMLVRAQNRQADNESDEILANAREIPNPDKRNAIR